MRINRYAVFAALALAAYAHFQGHLPARSSAPALPVSEAPAGSMVAEAFADHRSNIQVTGEGVVRKVLSDDRRGTRHQRFILALPDGQTVLVAHNIDLAPRVDDLRPGDRIRFSGEYEWNDKGGVVHWTHRDPAGRHPGGWLEREGRRYR